MSKRKITQEEFDEMKTEYDKIGESLQAFRKRIKDAELKIGMDTDEDTDSDDEEEKKEVDEAKEIKNEDINILELGEEDLKDGEEISGGKKKSKKSRKNQSKKGKKSKKAAKKAKKNTRRQRK